MNSGSDFLIELNGVYSYWYDVVLYDLGYYTTQDEIAENTQYYVLAGDSYPTPSYSAPRFYVSMYPFIMDLRTGDGVVNYYSAKLANPKAVLFTIPCFHTSMWNNDDYYKKVASLLAISDNKLPINSGTSSSVTASPKQVSCY
jgi:hypothetical protein